MIKEYRTIAEIAGPLMVVRQVERATFDELVEIELSDGSVRRGKVLEVNGDSLRRLSTGDPTLWRRNIGTSTVWR